MIQEQAQQREDEQNSLTNRDWARDIEWRELILNDVQISQKRHRQSDGSSSQVTWLLPVLVIKDTES